jgi:hypothetical protein
MPRLTEYLLKLATDAGELKKYRALRDEHREKLFDYLTSHAGAGLTKEQAHAIQSHDSRRVVHAVTEELSKETSRPDNPFYGVAVTILCEVNNIETRCPSD